MLKVRVDHTDNTMVDEEKLVDFYYGLLRELGAARKCGGKKGARRKLMDSINALCEDVPVEEREEYKKRTINDMYYEILQIAIKKMSVIRTVTIGLKKEKTQCH